MKKGDKVKYVASEANKIDDDLVTRQNTKTFAVGQKIRNEMSVKKVECALYDIRFALERYTIDDNISEDLKDIHAKIMTFLVKHEVNKSAANIIKEVEKDLLKKLEK